MPHINHIHPTAIIDPKAIIGNNNYIGPYCYIGPTVELGDGNRLEMSVSLGMSAQHRTHKTIGPVKIGNKNVFREFVTVHCPIEKETTVGNNGYFMACSHIAHDCFIEDDVTMANAALLGGHTIVMCGANLGLGVTAHQRSVIGSYTMIGQGAVLTRSTQVLPGCVYVGNPAKLLKENKVGITRAKISRDHLDMEVRRWEKLRAKNL